MWERKYKHCRWNGVTLNLLSTSIDGGKRLHTTELAYAELPSIKVMGSKAKAFTFDVVFVGADSLVKSNQLLSSLDKEPKGSFEHPWLGELSLVFQSYSEQLTTARGLVTLSLSFVRSGKQSTVTVSRYEERVHSKADKVVTVSRNGFSDDVEKMDVGSLNKLRARLTSVVTTLSGISNRLNVPSQLLTSLNTELNRLETAISSVANAPRQFAEQLSETMDSVAKAVRSEERSDNEQSRTVYEAIDNSRLAQSEMLMLIEPGDGEFYLNLQLMVGAVKMNRTLESMEKQSTFDVVSSSVRYPVLIADYNALSRCAEDRISEVTQMASMENYVVYDALVSLKDGIDAQTQKVVKGSTPIRHENCDRAKNVLELAHESRSKETLISALTEDLHPLFMQGSIAVEVMS